MPPHYHTRPGLPARQGHAADCSAAEFIVRTVHAHPGRVTVLALAPLTNIAQALMLDPQLGDKWVRGCAAGLPLRMGGGGAGENKVPVTRVGGSSTVRRKSTHCSSGAGGRGRGWVSSCVLHAR